jgi:hypothetical protein
MERRSFADGLTVALQCEHIAELRLTRIKRAAARPVPRPRRRAAGCALADGRTALRPGGRSPPGPASASASARHGVARRQRPTRRRRPGRDRGRFDRAGFFRSIMTPQGEPRTSATGKGSATPLRAPCQRPRTGARQRPSRSPEERRGRSATTGRRPSQDPVWRAQHSKRGEDSSRPS